ncbi:hypothetical protein [Chondrinema litorale]|uniref:hypothetical protein n=1 Tax=Chondrinema litorale TaxID=2994555 RepID=UPI0025432745|nr:hypothetical protein [Chondrinema litorale]UZR98649.1 hypothetical protein OQ292_33000 [Chondrinema litorale]
MEDLHVFIPVKNSGSRYSKGSLLYLDVYRLLGSEIIEKRKNLEYLDISLEGSSLVEFSGKLQKLIKLKLKNRTSCIFNEYLYTLLDEKLYLNPKHKIDHFHIIVLSHLWESAMTSIKTNNQIFFYSIPINFNEGETLTYIINKNNQGITKSLLLQKFNDIITKHHRQNLALDTQKIEQSKLDFFLKTLLNHKIIIEEEINNEKLFFPTEKSKNILIF